MQPTLYEIEKIIEELSAKIQVPAFLLPSRKTSEGTHIDIDHGLLFYISTERGQGNFRYLAKDLDDLLYKIFEGSSLMMASNYELKHKIKGQDFRRIMWEEQGRLLGILNEKWKLRHIKLVEQILINHPFDDNASIRVDYYQILLKSGQHVGNELALAYEKYPPLDKQ